LFVNVTFYVFQMPVLLTFFSTTPSFERRHTIKQLPRASPNLCTSLPQTHLHCITLKYSNVPVYVRANVTWTFSQNSNAKEMAANYISTVSQRAWCKFSWRLNQCSL